MTTPMYPVYSAGGCLWKAHLDKTIKDINNTHATTTFGVEDCQSMCVQDNNCNAISYDQHNRQCLLQNATINAVALQENDSGIYLEKLDRTCSK